MKKRKTAIVVVIVILAVAVVVFLVRLLRPPVVVETLEIIPSNAIFALEAGRPVETWKKVADSRFGRELAASELWEQTGVGRWFEELDDQIRSATGGLMTGKAWEDLFGRGAAVALIPSPLEGGHPALLGVSRPGLRTRVMETAARAFDGLRRETDRLMRVDEYNGYRLVDIGPSDAFPFFIGYSLGGDFLAVVVSQDPPAPVLRRVIDLRLSPETEPSLYRSGRYREVSRVLETSADDWLEMYFDFDHFRALLQTLGDTVSITGPEMIAAQWEDVIDGFRRRWEAQNYMGARLFWNHGPAVRVAAVTDPNDPAGPAPGDADYTLPAAFFLMPSEPLFCFVGRTDPPALWKEWRELHQLLSPGAEEPFRGLAEWEAAADFSLEADLLSLLGDEAAFLLDDIDFDGLFPLPRAAVVLKARAAAELEAALDGIIARLAAAEQIGAPARMTYSEVEITFFPIPLLAQPSYSLIGDLLVISSSRELMVDLIDTAQGRTPSLLASPLFLELSSRVSPAAEEFGLVNTGTLIDRLIRLEEWFRELGLSPTGRGDEGEQTLRIALSSLRLFRRFEGLAWNRRRVKNISILDGCWYIEDERGRR